MKLRNGFVSNSSSSSFIVRLKDWNHPDVEDISTTKINKLKKFGFYYSYAAFPFQVGVCKKDPLVKTGCSLCYDIPCNEDGVIDFLIKNKISFMADLHYDHFSMNYDGEDSVCIFVNFGKYNQMGHSIKECKRLKPAIQLTRDEVLSKTFSYQQVIYKKR